MAKRNACALDFGDPKKKQDEAMQNACRSFLKFQVVIISLGKLYCESIVKMKRPMDL